MAEEKTIEIWASPNDEDTRSAFPSFRKTQIETTYVETSVLASNLKQLLADFQQILDAQPDPSSRYHLEEIELNLGVNAEGGFALIGKLEETLADGIGLDLWFFTIARQYSKMGISSVTDEQRGEALERAFFAGSAFMSCGKVMENFISALINRPVASGTHRVFYATAGVGGEIVDEDRRSIKAADSRGGSHL